MTREGEHKRKNIRKTFSICYSCLGHARDGIFRIHRFEPLAFPLLLLLFILMASFGELVDDVLEGDLHEMDEAIMAALRSPGDISNPVGPPWLTEMMRDFSALGGTAILTILALTAALYLLIQRKYFRSLFLLASIGAGTFLTNILKAGFDRPRPDIVPHETYVYTASFPSGHSMMAAVVYLTLGGLLADNEKQKRMKIFILLIACLMAFLVGISRVYLGAHWPSDVIAGWLTGSAWAMLFWLLERYLLYRQSQNNTRAP